MSCLTRQNTKSSLLNAACFLCRQQAPSSDSAAGAGNYAAASQRASGSSTKGSSGPSMRLRNCRSATRTSCSSSKYCRCSDCSSTAEGGSETKGRHRARTRNMSQYDLLQIISLTLCFRVHSMASMRCTAMIVARLRVICRGNDLCLACSQIPRISKNYEHIVLFCLNYLNF